MRNRTQLSLSLGVSFCEFCVNQEKKNNAGYVVSWCPFSAGHRPPSSVSLGMIPKNKKKNPGFPICGLATLNWISRIDSNWKIFRMHSRWAFMHFMELDVKVILKQLLFIQVIKSMHYSAMRLFDCFLGLRCHFLKHDLKVLPLTAKQINI